MWQQETTMLLLETVFLTCVILAAAAILGAVGIIIDEVFNGLVDLLCQLCEPNGDDNGR
jgi:hypothetical protein